MGVLVCCFCFFLGGGGGQMITTITCSIQPGMYFWRTNPAGWCASGLGRSLVRTSGICGLYWQLYRQPAEGAMPAQQGRPAPTVAAYRLTHPTLNKHHSSFPCSTKLITHIQITFTEKKLIRGFWITVRFWCNSLEVKLCGPYRFAVHSCNGKAWIG